MSATEREPVDPNKIITPSNIITMIRICLVPVFIAVLLCPWPEWFHIPDVTNSDKRIIAAVLFIIISCSDWLDGYLARSRNEITNFGKFMDPLADKILVVSALIALVELDALPTWVVVIIIAREFIVSGVRMMAATEGVVIAASYLGKFKTVFTMIAIVLFTIKDSHTAGTFGSAMQDPMWVISWAFMIVALVLTVVSMIDYIAKARVLFNAKSEANRMSEEALAVEEHIDELSQAVVAKLIEKKMKVCTAESLTGGLIAAALTSVSGSSEVVLGGIVSYDERVKQSELGVDGELLAREGAVCEGVARQMADGARKRLSADIAVAVTGIAGPTGAEPGKPVGTVWMGVSTAKGTQAKLFTFSGDRSMVRNRTVETALEALFDLCDE